MKNGLNLLFFLLSFTYVNAQNDLIKISAETKYEIFVNNISEVNLSVKIGTSKKIFLAPRAKKTVRVTRKIRSQSFVQLTYPKQNYISDTTQIGLEIRKNLQFRDQYAEINDQIEGEEWEVIEQILKQYELGNNITTLYKKLYDFEKIFLASSENVKNEWTHNFQKISFKNIIKGKKGISPKGELTFGLPIYRQNINTFFSRKKASRFSYNAGLTLRLLPEVRMDKKANTFVNVFAFVDYERLGNRFIPSDEISLLIDRSYLVGDQVGLTKLQSQLGINILQKRASVGGYLRLLMQRALYIDIGMGYNFSNRIQLDFDGEEDNSLFFNMGEKLQNNKVTNIGEQETPFYYLLQIGILGKPNLTFQLKLIPNPAFNPTDNYKLFYSSLSQPTPQLVPLNNEPIRKYGIHVSFNIGFQL